MIMKERNELMVVPGSNPTRRTAHFLTPTFSSSSTTFNLPPTAFRSHHQNLPSRVSFAGWKNPLRNWNEWVDRMKPLHQSTWHKAGIYHAVIASTYQIKNDNELVFALSERWCSETNSFVFPWGEATVSLEDVFILGGYSVLGNSVIAPVEAQDEEEFVQIDEKLNKVRTMMNKSKSKKVTQGMWMDHFMDSGSELEHDAFLVLWLSRHVFPFSRESVGRHLHKIAFTLARGTRVALAPAVLACLYQDLRSLKENIVDFSEERVNLWSYMQIIQVWTWERFPALRPQSNIIGEGEPRMGRWDNIGKESKVWSVRLAIDAAAESFVWRPYTISEKYEFYPEMEKLVSVGPGMRDDYISFVKFVRVSELVGLDCVEPYFSHRVSMQFGIDQDIPGKVARFDRTPDIAWNNFNRPIVDEKLYIPSRVFESAVTRRYLNWWKDSKLVHENVVGSNDRLSLASSSNSSKKDTTVVEDIATSRKKKAISGKTASKTKGAAKARTSRKKMGNDQGIKIIDVHEISDDDSSSQHAMPQIPQYPPGFEPNDIQTEPPNEPSKVSESVIARHDENEIVGEHPIDGITSSHNDKEEDSVKAASLKKLKDIPLEARIGRLEILAAKLKRMAKLKRKRLDPN